MDSDGFKPQDDIASGRMMTIGELGILAHQAGYALAYGLINGMIAGARAATRDAEGQPTGKPTPPTMPTDIRVIEDEVVISKRVGAPNH